MRQAQTAAYATLSTSVLLITHVRMGLLVSSAPSVIPTTIAHALLTMVDKIVIVSIIMCASIWESVTHSYRSLLALSVCVLPCPLGYGPNSACTGCVPVHICVTDNPCENGGTCNIGTNNNTDYTCSCAPNFSGTNCTSKLTLGSQHDVRTALYQSEIMQCKQCKVYRNSLHLLKQGCNAT